MEVTQHVIWFPEPSEGEKKSLSSPVADNVIRYRRNYVSQNIPCGCSNILTSSGSSIANATYRPGSPTLLFQNMIAEMPI